MRRIIKIMPVILIGIFLLGLSGSANAQFGNWENVKFPKIDQMPWSVGQSATYKMTVSGIPEMTGNVTANIRMALVGKEAVEGQDFHWFEVDLSDMVVPSAEMPIPFKTLKIKVLMKYVAPDKYENDPKAALNDLASGKLMRKLVFQMDDQTPQMIDFMTIQGMVQGMTGQDFETMLKELPTETEEASKADVETKTGKESVTVPAGTFADATYFWFKGSEKESSVEGKWHAHSKIPLTSMAKMAMTVIDAKEKANIKLGLDLVKYETTGAASLIKGTPVPFDFMQFMGGMGGMEMGGMD